MKKHEGWLRNIEAILVLGMAAVIAIAYVISRIVD